MKLLPPLIAFATLIPTMPAFAGYRSGHHYGGTYQEMCYKNVYREQYVPGTYGRPGYVRRWNDRQTVPCYTANSYRPHRQPTYHPRPNRAHQPSRVDDNSCIEGSILGGIAGGAAGAALSRDEGMIIGIPLGIVGGALIGCQIDGG